MKRLFILLITVFMMFSISACSNNTTKDEVEEVVENNQLQNNNTNEEKILVVYFSATGTTENVAQMIANITNADIYEIIAADEYTSEDLNWNDSNSRTTIEQNDPSVRPKIASEKIALDDYNTIYIGYPIWWGEEPRIMDSFVESYSFDGKTMIPFCTSGSSGIGRSGKNLEENAGTGIWLEGKRFGSNVSEADLKSWIEGIR